MTQLLQPLVKDGTVKRAYMIDLKNYEEISESFCDSFTPKDVAGDNLIINLLNNMFKHVKNQLKSSFDSFLEYDKEKANLSLEMDYTTNNMVEKVRTAVETVLSLNQYPEFSKSLLYNEVAYDLERIGDYCAHISKFVINDDYIVDDKVLKTIKKMYSTSRKMINLSMKAFLEGKTELKEDIKDLEKSLHILQSKAVNLIATQMAENTIEERERSNYFMYLFRVIKAFKRMGDICIEIMEVSLEFHDNIPRSTTPRTFR